MILFKQIISYLIDNGAQIMAIIAALMTFLGLLVRLTPTKTDDQAFERLDKWLQKLFDILKVPNYRAGGGTHPTLEETEATKQAALEKYQGVGYGEKKE
jgi:hypothetical protein